MATVTPNLAIIHLRARIHRLYKFQKTQFFILISISILSLLILLFYLSNFITDWCSILPLNADNNYSAYENLINTKYEDDDNKSKNNKEDDDSLTFYEKMLEDYKDEIGSSEDLQLKVMNDIIKDSIDYIGEKSEKEKRNIERRLRLAQEQRQKKLDNLKNEARKTQQNQQKVPHSSNSDDSEIIIDEITKEEKIIDGSKVNHNHLSKQEDGDDQYYDESIFIPKDKLAPIKRLFANILPIIIECEPQMGFQLRNEREIGAKSRKFRLSKKIIPRSYGKNGIINIAIHDSTEKFPILSREYLSESLYLPTDMFEDLQQSHQYFVNNIPDSYSDNTYSGNGIVFIGGGKFSWLTLLSIENIRSSGSKLPIEVMIPQPEDYEPQLCEIILPKLNAKCLLLYDIFPDIIKQSDKSKSFKLTGYQYKSLSLLASTFEKVLFLDSDNIAVRNPDSLFVNEPFTSHGMILWPDFWKRVTHPMFYDLAGFNITERRVRNLLDKVTPSYVYTTGKEDPDSEIPLHDREGAIPDLTSESGQIIVDKRTHFKALLLSFYYNVYGPRHFYPLFSQGGNGEGDKETFIAASIYYDLPVYQMNKPVGVIGHWDYYEDGTKEYGGVGMIQFDPITDKINQDSYEQIILSRIEKEGSRYKYNNDDYSNYLTAAVAKPMFIHSNYPKLDPVSLFRDSKLINPKTDKPWRMYSDQPDIGFDFEMKQWTLIGKYFCSKTEPLDLQYLKDSEDSLQQLCGKIKKRLQFLENTPLIIEQR